MATIASNILSIANSRTAITGLARRSLRAALQPGHPFVSPVEKKAKKGGMNGDLSMPGGQ